VIDRQQIQAGIFQTVDQPIITQNNLSHDRIIELANDPARLGKGSNALNSLKDIYNQEAGILRRVSSDKFDD
jgi:hypothetical protein